MNTIPNQLEKKVVTLEQQQVNIGNKNVSTRLEGLHTRIQQLEQKGKRQAAEIQTLQGQLQQNIKVYVEDP